MGNGRQFGGRCRECASGQAAGRSVGRVSLVRQACRQVVAAFRGPRSTTVMRATIRAGPRGGIAYLLTIDRDSRQGIGEFIDFSGSKIDQESAFHGPFFARLPLMLSRCRTPTRVLEPTRTGPRPIQPEYAAQVLPHYGARHRYGYRVGPHPPRRDRLVRRTGSARKAQCPDPQGNRI